MNSILSKNSSIIFFVVVTAFFGYFADSCVAEVIVEEQFSINERVGQVATSTVNLRGINLIVPTQNYSATTSVRLSILNEPLIDLVDAKPISQIYQIDFSRALGTNYSFDLDFTTSNNFYKQVYYYDGVTKAWRPLPTSENVNAKTVSAQLNFPFVRLAVFEHTSVLSKGKASWYVYKGGLFAASPDYKTGTRLLVSSVSNPGKNIIVTVNDYGPDRKVHPERVIDLDKVAFAALAPLGAGVIDVFVQPVGSTMLNTVAASDTKDTVVVQDVSEPISDMNKDDLSRAAVVSLVGAALPNFKSGELWQNNKTGGVYWAQEQSKRPLSDRVFLSTIFKGRKIIKKTPAELAKLKTLAPVVFPSASLLKAKNSATVYLIYKDQKRAFVSGSIFESLGYIWNDIVEVPASLVARYPEGLTINSVNTKASTIVLTSKAAYVLGQDSGRTLYAKNPTLQLPLASLSKLVALKVFLDTKPNLNQVVTYKIQDENFNYEWADKSVLARLKVSDGETLTIRDLLYSAVIGSANNAVESLVRVSGLSRPDFIARMNKYAISIGATQTRFVEPTGLSPQNVSSAEDYAKIARVVLSDGNLEKVSMTKTYSFTTVNKKIVHNLKNSNSLFFTSNLQITGSKTGYLDEALYCLMTRAKDSKGKEVIAVTFGTPTKAASYKETNDLLSYGFKMLD